MNIPAQVQSTHPFCPRIKHDGGHDMTSIGGQLFVFPPPLPGNPPLPLPGKPTFPPPLGNPPLPLPGKPTDPEDPDPLPLLGAPVVTR